MGVIPLSALDLALASLGVLALAAMSWRLRLGIAGRLVVAALRTAIQLLLVGLVLRTLFAHASLGWVALISVAMLLVAGREVLARQERRFGGWRGYGIGTSSMFVSSFVVTVLVLSAIIEVDPWYAPRYAIPLLGMVLGNTMTGVAVALDRLTRGAWDKRAVIEQRLILGEDRVGAIGDLARESIRSGLIPIMNAMAAAGIVSLPGMMTGQILAGTSPLEAVRYQILIVFSIATGTGLGTICAVWMAARRLFDGRHRLRLERLEPSAG